MLDGKGELGTSVERVADVRACARQIAQGLRVQEKRRGSLPRRFQDLRAELLTVVAGANRARRHHYSKEGQENESRGGTADFRNRRNIGPEGKRQYIANRGDHRNEFEAAKAWNVDEDVVIRIPIGATAKTDLRTECA